jgi:hypothetical protein
MTLNDSDARRDELNQRLTDAEDDVRMQRHLSDDELRGQIHSQIAREQAAVDASITRGERFVVAGNDKRKVHNYNCPTLSRQMDRSRAWSWWITADAEDLRTNIAHGYPGPRMPDQRTRADVETLSTYVTCQVCSPTVDHVRKKRAPRLTKLTSLGSQHIGRELTSGEQSLGSLVRITTSISAVGTTVTIETTTGEYDTDALDTIQVGPLPHVTP